MQYSCGNCKLEYHATTVIGATVHAYLRSTLKGTSIRPREVGQEESGCVGSVVYTKFLNVHVSWG